MTNIMSQVFDDIRDTMWHEAKRANQVQSTAVPRSSSQMCMATAWGTISTRFTQPLRPDLSARLQAEIRQHPEMLDAPDYPGNIVEWIEAHLFDWDKGDLLGAYLPLRKAVELYWLSIVLCARRNRWEVSDLAEVVLIHEFAHGCMHLGKDANGLNWDTDAFNRQTTDVIEGLAQYWTHYVLMRVTTRQEALLTVFLGLMKKQPAQYRSHMTWLEEKAQEIYQNHGISVVKDLETDVPFHMPICEHVRAAMIRLREEKTSPSAKEFTDAMDLGQVASSQSAKLF